MTGKDYLLQVVDLCKQCQSQVEALELSENKGDFLKTLEEQRSTIEGLMERVFFKTPKGTNSASIVLESAQKLNSLTVTLAQGSQDERTKLWAEADEGLNEFTDRVEGLIQAAQGKTLAFT
jgi:porphobilinogen deaminase